MQTISLTLKGTPISTQHAYWQRGKIRYMKKEAKLLKESYVKQAMLQYIGKPIDTVLSVYIRLYFGDNTRRDIDNWHKLTLDALSWVVYEDDKQIKLATIQIMDKSDRPRIEIVIEQL